MTRSPPMIHATDDGASPPIRYTYQCDEQIGTGASSVVYRARRLPIGEAGEAQEWTAADTRLVALKVCRRLADKGRLYDEAELLNRIAACPLPPGQINRVIRVGAGGRPLSRDNEFGSQDALLELEYLDGPTLRARLDGAWASPPPAPADLRAELLTVAREIAEALHQISLVEIAHRDIKPENLICTVQGLRLFDFNVARVLTPEERAETHVGTNGYLAPEIDQGEGYDHRADLWSLGVILWEIMHRRRFDLYRDTVPVPGGRALRPDALPGEEAARALLACLLAPPAARLPDAAALLQHIHALEGAIRPAPTDPLDLIGLLTELREGGMVAVVSDSLHAAPGMQDLIRKRIQIEDPLEEWLTRRVQDLAREARPSLIVLAGNAGDGKSHLLNRVYRHRLTDPTLQRMEVIVDATHALSPDGSQHDRLRTFFAPFLPDAQPPGRPLRVIAMNTGMAISFFEQQPDLAPLWEELQIQLGLTRRDRPAPPWTVEVINLDLRDLLRSHDRPAPLPAAPSFAARMLDRLDPANPDGLPALRSAGCDACPARTLCPVRFNLDALARPTVRRHVLGLLQRVALDTEVHLSPRNLWGFWYRLLTGGAERYAVPDRGGMGMCDVVRHQAQHRRMDWLLAGQFTESLFSQREAGPIWASLAKHDPAFSSARVADDLHTRLSIKSELDHDPAFLQDLGGEGRSLYGLALDVLNAALPAGSQRRDAAVRRAVLCSGRNFQLWQATIDDASFRDLLTAYDTFSRQSGPPGRPVGLTPGQQEILQRVLRMIQEVFIRGHGRDFGTMRALKISQPTHRGNTELLIRAENNVLSRIFNIKDSLPRDIHIAAHEGRLHLLDLLGYRPRAVTLTVQRIRLSVDVSLYAFLRRVQEGQQPSSSDIAEFQALSFLAERVGNELVRQQTAPGKAIDEQELLVYTHRDSAAAPARLYRMSVNGFGVTEVTPQEI